MFGDKYMQFNKIRFFAPCRHKATMGPKIHVKSACLKFYRSRFYGKECACTWRDNLIVAGSESRVSFAGRGFSSGSSIFCPECNFKTSTISQVIKNTEKCIRAIVAKYINTIISSKLPNFS